MTGNGKSGASSDDYCTPADLLAHGFDLPQINLPVVALPPGTSCALTGQPIRRGVRVGAVTTGATTEFLDHFHGDVNGFISETAARCYKMANPRTGNILARSIVVFRDAPGMLPLIARDRARSEGRPCWSDLVCQLWPERRGQVCLMILTTDTKKRLWPRARVGALGSHTPIYYYDAPTAGNGVIFVDWAQLIRCLDLVEEVYTAGFPKLAIRENLYLAGHIAQDNGLCQVRQWEQGLAPWRGSAEFAVATLIAQKREEVANANA